MTDWRSIADEIFKIQERSVLPEPVRILIITSSILLFPVFAVLEQVNSDSESVKRTKWNGAEKIEEMITSLPGANYLESWLSDYYINKISRKVKSDGETPNHIGIIMDGNRRFAKNLDAAREAGHAIGAEKLEKVLDWAKEIGIRYGTVYAFSKENMNRSEEEVEELMDLFEQKFRQIAKDPRIHENEIRVRAIGNKDELPNRVKDAIEKAENATKNYDKFVLNIGVNYGGRKELVEATRKLCEKVDKGKLEPNDIDEEMLDKNLYMSDLPDPDLIIRTSGEERLSGFLLWRSAYSELYFCETNWPAFTKLDLLQAVSEYQNRERRFGR